MKNQAFAEVSKLEKERHLGLRLYFLPVKRRCLELRKTVNLSKYGHKYSTKHSPLQCLVYVLETFCSSDLEVMIVNLGA